MTDQLGVVWAAVTEDSVERLKESIPFLYIPQKHFHLTLRYGVRREPYTDIIGKEVPLFIDSYQYNEVIQAMKISLRLTDLYLRCKNHQPHITWSKCEDISSVESNEMLDDVHSVSFIDYIQVQTIVEFHSLDNAKLLTR
jgi:hypothetical protein